MTRRRRIAPWTLLLVGLLATSTALAHAQGVRISGVTTVQLIELRPFVVDSLPASSLPGTGSVRRSPDGVPAICSVTTGFCRFESSGARVSATPVVQDVTLAGWGWVEGLSFRANVRARTQPGGGATFAWPRADDHFDVIDAYAELDRGAWRGRLGRQWVTGGLGAYNFDGANATWRRDSYAVEGWAGRALVAGLNEPYTSPFLAAADNLPPDQGGFVFGLRGRYRGDPLNAAQFTYQRVLVADRSGLYSERIAANGSTRRFGAQFDAALTYDLAYGDWNEARLRAGTGGMRAVAASVEVRRSRPYFDLWTIWGAFAPVGFDEARASLDWRPGKGPLAFTARGGFRQYAATDAGLDLRTNGWRAGVDAMLTATNEFSASASYDVDIGSGAANTDIRAGARWMPSERSAVGLDGSVTQNIYEFRIGTGRIYGLALSAAIPLGSDARVVADGGAYRHVMTNGAVGPDWTQRRASIRLEWTVGRDPGTGAGNTP